MKILISIVLGVLNFAFAIRSIMLFWDGGQWYFAVTGVLNILAYTACVIAITHGTDK